MILFHVIYDLSHCNNDTIQRNCDHFQDTHDMFQCRKKSYDLIHGFYDLIRSTRLCNTLTTFTFEQNKNGRLVNFEIFRLRKI